MSFQHLLVVMGTPHQGMVPEPFMRCVDKMGTAFRTYMVPGWKKQSLRTMLTLGSVLSRSRLGMLKAAKKMEADYLLFIDSDQTFPATIAHQLIKHRVDVVGANIAVKKIPSNPTARNKGADGTPVPVYTDEDSTGLEQVWRLGTGILCLSKKVIKSLPHSCFEMRYVPEIDDYQGEDWSLCVELEKLGIPIYVDHDLSKLVGHLGTYEFTHDVVGEVITQGAEYVDSPEPLKAGIADAVGGVFGRDGQGSPGLGSGVLTRPETGILLPADFAP